LSDRIYDPAPPADIRESTFLPMWLSADNAGVQSQESRLQGLVEAGIALSSELSLDALLQRIVETTAALTGARYAALGVIDVSGRELERFITHGIDPETHAAIGDLPRGRGILGVLIREATPLRLHDIAEDARSVGFPPHHPPMKTFLGVPVILRGVAYGNLYLTEKEGGGEFTDEDEELVTLLASQAAVAIENARLYESSRSWARQLESLNEITAAMASEVDPGRLLKLIVTQLRELLDARFVAILLPDGEDWLELTAADGEEADELVGFRLSASRSKAGRVFQQGASVRVDTILDDPDVDPELARRVSARAGLWVPLLARGRAIGVLMAFDRRQFDPRFSDGDVRVAESFAGRTAIAVDLSRRVARETVQRIVEAQELERRRLSHELHDETGQALTSILLGLKTLEEARGQDEFSTAVGQLRELVVATLQDVRRLAVELRPKALDDFGLAPALERLTETFAEQTGIAVELESRLPGARLPSEVETVLYRVVQEALTNVVKHARAERVSILLRERDGRVAAVIEDDGRGFSPEAETGEGLGLVGMRERVALVDGRLDVESAAGSGTTIVVEVPLR
jgi:signal transduction histidine kinase